MDCSHLQKSNEVEFVQNKLFEEQKSFRQNRQQIQLEMLRAKSEMFLSHFFISFNRHDEQEKSVL